MASGELQAQPHFTDERDQDGGLKLSGGAPEEPGACVCVCALVCVRACVACVSICNS